VLNCGLESCGLNCEDFSCDTCPAGFSGKFCSIDIDDCTNATCDDHMTCMDGVDMHTCTCLPGYTSQNCSVDINECLEDSACSYNGKCINEEGTYHCECDPEHTGQFCESSIDRYVVEITFHSFYHDLGRCSDNSSPCNSSMGCCDSKNCFTAMCDYMFLFCQRFAFAPVSIARSENRGNCKYQETRSARTSIKEEFFGNVYGIPNPIVLPQANWVRSDLYSRLVSSVFNDRAYKASLCTEI